MSPLYNYRWRDKDSGEGVDAIESLIQKHAWCYAPLLIWAAGYRAIQP